MSFLHLNKKKESLLSDEQLLTSFRESGDNEIFGELYNRYIPLIYGVCLKYLQNADKSQDAVMEIFELLLPKINKYEIKVFRIWLYSVVKNHCFHLIKNNKREIAFDFDSDLMDLDELDTLLDESDVDKEKEDALEYCIAKLSEPQRICISMFFYEDMSYTDIAETTGFDIKSVKSYIQNGKRNLKLCIESRLRLNNETS